MTGDLSQADWLALLPEAAAVVSIDGRILEANDAFRALVAPRDARGAALSDLVAEANGDLTARLRGWARSKHLTPGRLVLRTARGAEELAVQAGRLSPPGADPPVLLVRCRPRASAAERFHLLNEKIDALSHEVLARQRAEQEAQDQRDRFRITLTSIGDAVITTDCEQNVTFMNPVAERLTGWSAADAARGRFADVFRIVNQKSGEPAPDPCDQVLSSGRPVALANDTLLIARDGKRYIIEDTAAPIHDAQGTMQGVVVVFHDATERHEAQRRIQQQQEWFRTTLASIGDAVIATDEAGRVVFMNPVAERHTGWTLGDAKGRDSTEVFRIINEETRKRVESPITRVVRDGAMVGLANHTILIARDGTEHPIDDSGAPIRDAEGRLIGVVLVFRDISERRRREADIHRSHALLQAITEGTTDAVFVKDGRGVYLTINTAGARLLGRAPDEVIGRDDAAVMPPEAARQAIAADRRVIDTGATETFEEEIGLPGGRLTMLTTKAPHRDERGRIIGVVGIARDITERKRSEQALRESEERFRSMADSAPVLIAMSDATGACTYFNRQWLEFTGRRIEQQVGDGWTRSIHPHDRDRAFNAYLRAFEAREPLSVEFRLRRRDGEHRWMLGHAQPRCTPDGTFAGYIGTCVDITERQRAEQQLLSINETLEQRVHQRTAQLRELAQQLTRAEQRERRRLAQTLHDHLQQLLVAARMRADLLIRRTDGPDLGEAVREVQELIRQALEASRSLTVELSPPVLYDGGLCAALPWLARRMEERHGLRVAIHADTDAEPRDEETRVSLFLAVRELLFNIVKHAGTDTANVDLSLSHRGAARLVVEDPGAGFDPAAVEDAPDRSGFGLFNLRERIGFLGGRLRVHSEPGRGTRIVVELPLKEPAAELPASGRGAAPAAVRPAARGAGADRPIRVLLADDHRILREGVAGILAEHPDLRVVAQAADGRQAVELARRSEPDVIVMDVTMPQLNGIEATRRIAEQVPTAAVVGLSMHDSEDMARAMVEAGAFRMLVKDGPADVLVTTIREAAAARARR